MNLIIQVQGEAAGHIRDLARRPLTKARQQLVRDVMSAGLQQIIQKNPVDTGRSRAAWVSSLKRLGGDPPTGWEGSHPRNLSQGAGQGQLNILESDDRSEITATNSVNYIQYLEYGTSRTAPIAMVRSSLLRLASQVATMFRLGN